MGDSIMKDLKYTKKSDKENLVKFIWQNNLQVVLF